jgi:hypothetical protein
MSTNVSVRVVDDGYGVPGSKSHCAIANALMLADPDILYAKADRQYVRFSRRSTGMRYTFATPARAAAFIDTFDAGAGHGKRTPADPFTLKLSEDNLVEATPRKKVKREQSIRYRAPGRKVEKPSPLRNRSSSLRES